MFHLTVKFTRFHCDCTITTHKPYPRKGNDTTSAFIDLAAVCAPQLMDSEAARDRIIASMPPRVAAQMLTMMTEVAAEAKAHKATYLVGQKGVRTACALQSPLPASSV